MTLSRQDAPERLLGDTSSPASLRQGLELLAAQEVPAAVRARMARNLGLGSPPVPSGGGGPSLAARLGVGLGVGVTVGALAMWMMRPHAAARVAVDPTPVVAEEAPPVPAAPLVSAPAVATSAVISVPPITVSGPAPGVAAAGGSASSGVVSAKGSHVTSPSVSATQPNEAELLRDAGAALRGGNASRALELVDELAARFPNGTFAQERDVLRIDALVALGKQADARERARAFLTAHPESAHRTHLEDVLTQP